MPVSGLKLAHRSSSSRVNISKYAHTHDKIYFLLLFFPLLKLISLLHMVSLSMWFS